MSAPFAWAPARSPGTVLAAFSWRPATRPGRAALLTVNLATVTVFLLDVTPHGVGFGPYHIDLGIYRLAGQRWLHGGDLYAHLPAPPVGPHLPFTYPPIAAVLLASFSLVPMTVAGTVSTVGSVALLAVVARMLLRRLPGPAARSWWAVAWLLPPATALEPVRDTVYFGQVNIILMTLVTADCLLRAPRWPRGTLVGLAAAVKLTPAVFVLFFLLRRDLRAAATAGGAFLAATAVGFLLDRHGSCQYWTRYVFQTKRIGSTTYASNQSILGLLTRAGLDPGTLPGAAAWLALSAVVLVAACQGMRYAFAASQASWALSLNAFAGLLISPISWSHHWVWCVPALLALAAASLRDHLHLPWVTALAGLFVFATSPQLWEPSGTQLELHWTVWQQALGNSYVLFAMTVVLLSAYRKPALASAPAAPRCQRFGLLPGTRLPGDAHENPSAHAAGCDGWACCDGWAGHRHHRGHGGRQARANSGQARPADRRGTGLGARSAADQR